MPLKFSDIAADLELEVGGRWFDYEDDARVKIARTNNSRMVEHLASLDDSSDESWADAVSRFVLLDLEGFIDESGEPIVYTPELGKKLLLDKRHHNFQLWVMRRANDEKNYRAKIAKEVSKK